MSALRPCAEGTTVFRSVKVGPTFPPDALRPLPGALRLTDADLTDGLARGEQALLSAWQRGITTLAQAFAMRPSAVPSSYRTVQWLVDDVRCIDGMRTETKLEVLEDPLPEEKGAGAEGHRGIVGLVDGCERASLAVDKLRAKAIEFDLAQACSPYVE